MAGFVDDFLLVVVLAVPGFLVVSIGRYLSGVGDDATQFDTARLVVVWSFVVDAVVVGLAPFVLADPVTDLESLRNALVGFQGRLLVLWFGLSAVFGVLYAAGIVLRLPHRARAALQSRSAIVRLPEQPWRDFFEEHDYVMVYAAKPDGSTETYAGWVYSYSSSKEGLQLVLDRPYRWREEWVPVVPDETRKNEATGRFVPDARSQLWIAESNIERVVALPEPEAIREVAAAEVPDPDRTDAERFWFPRGTGGAGG